MNEDIQVADVKLQVESNVGRKEASPWAPKGKLTDGRIQKQGSGKYILTDSGKEERIVREKVSRGSGWRVTLRVVRVPGGSGHRQATAVSRETAIVKLKIDKNLFIDTLN